MDWDLDFPKTDAADVWVSYPDGSGSENLTNTPGVHEGNPAFSPDGESKVRDRTPTVTAVVRDETDELTKADIRLRVDGRERGFSYAPDTDCLSHATNKLSYSRRTIQVTAEDAAGNEATERWSFRVVRRRR